MILKHISIANYRNIGEASLDLSAKLNCFVGDNGQGKTNFLDAVYYLSFCRSAYNPSDAQVMLHGADYFVLNGEYDDERGGIEYVYCGMKRGERKHFKRNKKDYRRFSEHIGLIPLVFISPSDTLIIDGGGDDRRKLLDVSIAQYDRSYIEWLNRYNKALQQRNVLLKAEETPDGALLDVLEYEMAVSGEHIYKLRSEFIDSIEPVFQRVYGYIAEDYEQVSLRYVSHCQRGDLLDVIQRDRSKDLAVGYSLHGIHRDDLEMMIGDYPMRREGSQGQQKTYAIALKLALFEYLKQKTESTTPLLLMDDIFDKLDAKRVERIVRLVSSETYGQIFITDTNRDHIDAMLHDGAADYRLFEVRDGNITIKEGADV